MIMSHPQTPSKSLSPSLSSNITYTPTPLRLEHYLKEEEGFSLAEDEEGLRKQLLLAMRSISLMKKRLSELNDVVTFQQVESKLLKESQDSPQVYGDEMDGLEEMSPPLPPNNKNRQEEDTFQGLLQQLKSLQENHELLQQEHEVSLATTDRLRIRCADMERKLDSADSHNREQSAKVGKIMEELQEAKSASLAFKDRCTSLEAERDELLHSLAESKSSHSKLRSHSTKLEAQLGVSEEATVDLKQKVEQLQLQLRSKDQLIDMLKKEVRSTGDLRQELEEERQTWMMRSRESDKIIEGLGRQLEEEQDCRRGLEAEIEQLQMQLDELRMPGQQQEHVLRREKSFADEIGGISDVLVLDPAFAAPSLIVPSLGAELSPTPMRSGPLITSFSEEEFCASPLNTYSPNRLKAVESPGRSRSSPLSAIDAESIGPETSLTGVLRSRLQKIVKKTSEKYNMSESVTSEEDGIKSPIKRTNSRRGLRSRQREQMRKEALADYERERLEEAAAIARENMQKHSGQLEKELFQIKDEICQVKRERDMAIDELSSLRDRIVELENELGAQEGDLHSFRMKEKEMKQVESEVLRLEQEKLNLQRDRENAERVIRETREVLMKEEKQRRDLEEALVVIRVEFENMQDDLAEHEQRALDQQNDQDDLQLQIQQARERVTTAENRAREAQISVKEALDKAAFAEETLRHCQADYDNTNEELEHTKAILREHEAEVERLRVVAEVATAEANAKRHELATKEEEWREKLRNTEEQLQKRQEQLQRLTVELEQLQQECQGKEAIILALRSETLVLKGSVDELESRAAVRDRELEAEVGALKAENEQLRLTAQQESVRFQQQLQEITQQLEKMTLEKDELQSLRTRLECSETALQSCQAELSKQQQQQQEQRRRNEDEDDDETQAMLEINRLQRENKKLLSQVNVYKMRLEVAQSSPARLHSPPRGVRSLLGQAKRGRPASPPVRSIRARVIDGTPVTGAVGGGGRRTPLSALENSTPRSSAKLKLVTTLKKRD